MPDKESDPDWWQCDRCEDWFHRRLDDEREWSRGGYHEDLPDGSVRVHDRLCNDCHRVVVRS